MFSFGAVGAAITRFANQRAIQSVSSRERAIDS
jgi:hypothetical protein